MEAVTREFFKEYKRVFDAALDRIGGFGTDESEQEAKKLFTQTLFNRLMFVYFISRKGWLSFNGDKDYLRALWRDYARRAGSVDGEPNFRYDRLRPLFFGGLNNDGSQDLTAYPDAQRLIGQVPFLNGGLFEETDLDRRTDVSVPDAVVRSIFDDLFDRFNFTVMESTPFDIEVAVDPEMLGKVFEELVTGRHESGSYYTPRPVVSFMCREALKGYLGGQDLGIDDNEIAVFVDEQDTSVINDISQAEEIAKVLNGITMVDPACGSGAYLLGMMQELVGLRTSLFNVGLDDIGMYNLKLGIIQRNLFGVDIDGFAVNIAMLRLWLSLAIEYEGDDPPPLPNLDFKIVCGDSLLGPDPSAASEAQATLGHDINLMRQLGQFKAEYIRAYTGHDKSRLRENISRVQAQVAESLGNVGIPNGAVDWRVEFAETFATRSGFDVVVANPPYVVIKDSRLREVYHEGVYGRMNTYGLFIQRSLQLMSDGAQLFFINPRTLLTDRYFTNLRKVIKRKAEVSGVVLIEDRHNTFARVLQECIILHLVRRTHRRSPYSINTRSVRIPTDLNDPQAHHVVSSEKALLGSYYDEAFYIGSSEFEYRIFERMDSVGKRLSDFGLKAATGKVQFDKYRSYAQASHTDGACRLIWAENVQRYVHRESRKRVGKEWLSGRIREIVPPNITGYGVITQRVSANEQPRRIIATPITPEVTEFTDVYSENHTNFISLDGSVVSSNLLIGMLNSSLLEYIFRRLNSNTQVSAGEVNKLPFPPLPDRGLREKIETLVGRLVQMGGVHTNSDMVDKAISIERELDVLIGSLYGLSENDVQRVWEQLPSYDTVYGRG